MLAEGIEALESGSRGMLAFREECPQLDGMCTCVRNVCGTVSFQSIGHTWFCPQLTPKLAEGTVGRDSASLVPEPHLRILSLPQQRQPHATEGTDVMSGKSAKNSKDPTAGAPFAGIQPECRNLFCQGGTHQPHELYTTSPHLMHLTL